MIGKSAVRLALKRFLLSVAGITAYLCLPLGVYLLLLRQHYHVHFLAYFGAHFLAVMVLLGLEALLPRKLRPRYATAIILGLWGFINTWELALKDYFGVGFSPVVFYHFSWLSVKIALLDYWAPLVGFLFLTSLGGWIFYRYWITPAREGYGSAKVYSLAFGAMALAVLILSPMPLKATLPAQTLISQMVAYYRPQSAQLYRRPPARLLKAFGVDTQVVSVPDLIVRRPAHPVNLILIYLEGFDLLYTPMDNPPYGDLTPNLDALARSATYLSNYYSSEAFTIAGLVTSQCGLLADVDSNSKMRARINYYKDLPALGDVLHQAGYYQLFMGGASKIWSGKDRFFRTHHYDETYGWEDWSKSVVYQTRNDHWGLYDMDLMREALKRVERLHGGQKPFNITMLTLDTHMPGMPAPDTPPYAVHDRYLESIRSTDRAIGWFVQELSRRHILADTALIITSDHHAAPSEARRKAYGLRSDDRILGIFKTPARRWPSVVSTVGYTPDLAPTVLDALGIQSNARFICGQSLFAPTRSRKYIVRDFAAGIADPFVRADRPRASGAAADGSWKAKNPATVIKRLRAYLSYATLKFDDAD